MNNQAYVYYFHHHHYDSCHCIITVHSTAYNVCTHKFHLKNMSCSDYGSTHPGILLLLMNTYASLIELGSTFPLLCLRSLSISKSPYMEGNFPNSWMVGVIHRSHPAYQTCSGLDKLSQLFESLSIKSFEEEQWGYWGDVMSVQRRVRWIIPLARISKTVTESYLIVQILV